MVARGMASRLRLKHRECGADMPGCQRRQGDGFSSEIETFPDAGTLPWS